MIRCGRSAPHLPVISKLITSLVFMGSKEYPFKGVLDQLANRAGSDGTNAWTANDREFARPCLHLNGTAQADDKTLRTPLLQLAQRDS